MDSRALGRRAHLAGRRMLTGAVRRLPLNAATVLRRPLAPGCLIPGRHGLTPLEARALPHVDLREHGTHDLIVLHPAGRHAGIRP